MHLQISTTIAHLKAAGNLGHLQHQRRAIHGQPGQRLPRGPTAFNPQGLACDDDICARLIRLDRRIMQHALQGDHPITANHAFVVTHRARNTGTANFTDPVHGRCRRRDADAISIRQGHTLKTVGILFLNKGRRHIAAGKFRVVIDGRQKRQVMPDPFNLKPIQRQAHFLNRRSPVRAPSAQLGDHRIIIHADLASLEHTSVIADGACVCRLFHGGAIAGQTPNRG